jgi:hypothetical protein
LLKKVISRAVLLSIGNRVSNGSGKRDEEKLIKKTSENEEKSTATSNFKFQHLLLI